MDELDVIQFRRRSFDIRFMRRRSLVPEIEPRRCSADGGLMSLTLVVPKKVSRKKNKQKN